MVNWYFPNFVIASPKRAKQSYSRLLRHFVPRNDSRIRLHRNARSGQSMVEFTFCMIVVFFMIYGLAKIFQWTGIDPAQRMKAHQTLLRRGGGVQPRQQMDSHFYNPVSFNAIWNQSP